MKQIAFGVVAAVVLLLSGSNAYAQAGKLQVHVDVTADDAVGRRLAFRFRDAIGKSGTFTEVGEDAGKGFKVTLVTLDPLNSGRMTVYSLAILIPNEDGLDYFVTSYVGVCGQDSLASCAQTMFEGLGEETEAIRQALRRNTGFN